MGDFTEHVDQDTAVASEVVHFPPDSPGGHDFAALRLRLGENTVKLIVSSRLGVYADAASRREAFSVALKEVASSLYRAADAMDDLRQQMLKKTLPPG